MLFRNKNCPKCGSSYDVVEDTCPVCHAHNDDFEALKVPRNQVWLPIYKQVMIFLFGIIALNIISELLGLLLAPHFEEKSVTLLLIVNAIRYSTVAGLIAVTLTHSYHKLKDSFIKILPYVAGVCAAILLIGVNMAFNAIVSLFYTTSVNENQALANSLVITYPFLSILLLGFIGPAVEEFTYRVGLFSFLSRIHRAVAYAVTIVIFAFIHFDFTATGDAIAVEFIHLPLYMFSGAALCLLYDYLGLSASITCHTLNNIFSILPVIFRNLVS